MSNDEDRSRDEAPQQEEQSAILNPTMALGSDEADAGPEFAAEIVSQTSGYELPAGGDQMDMVDIGSESHFTKLEEKIRARMVRGPRVREDPLLGQIFGDRFEIISRIGAGGMGVVYKARQRGMDRDVAIKVLLKEYLTNETAVKRFEREALAVSKLEHPNTVRIYDFGESVVGGLYIAMEHLSGVPLQVLVEREHGLPVRQVLRIIKQVCLSLEEAHGKGIIHRDLKPDNVFVGEVKGQRDFVKVLDFGVAKLREGGEGGTLTQHGTIFGTPKYMSPEQCRSHPVDGRSDLYSVGVMMYEMIAGRTPFESDNPLAILIMHAQDEVNPMAEVRPDLIVPFEVEALLHRLLEKEALDRPQDAREVADECDRLLRTIPVSFERVITYETAEREGMDYNRSAAYTVRNAAIDIVEEGAQMARDTVHVDLLPIPGPKTQWGSIALAAGAVLAIIAGVAAYVIAQMTPIPASAKQLVPDQWAAGNLPEIEPELVRVTLVANVDNVNVLNKADGAVLGVLQKADAPTSFQWLREPGRAVSVELTHGDAPPKEVTFELGQDIAVPTVELEVPDPVIQVVPEGAEMVAITIEANVGGAYIKVSGMDQAWPTDAEPGMREIRVLKGDEPVTVTLEKPGYLAGTVEVVPSEDRAVSIALEPDPAAAVPPVVEARTVTLTLTANVGKVDVTLGTGQLFRIGKARKALPIELAFGATPLELTFERRGYKKQTQYYTPTEDGALQVKLERVKRTGGKPAGEPEVLRINPIKSVEKKPEPGIGKIRRLK